jgi:hypothetical protein
VPELEKRQGGKEATSHSHQQRRAFAGTIPGSLVKSSGIFSGTQIARTYLLPQIGNISRSGAAKKASCLKSFG